ncbi:hypothetical protein M405DRAFT_838560 [Rhizopogon salebrosus TDB-379]|nr:hypothetical protein M405DRAFT_838560 [Rhizopogon salebrosus TDB-379]
MGVPEVANTGGRMYDAGVELTGWVGEAASEMPGEGASGGASELPGEAAGVGAGEAVNERAGEAAANETDDDQGRGQGRGATEPGIAGEATGLGIAGEAAGLGTAGGATGLGAAGGAAIRSLLRDGGQGTMGVALSVEHEGPAIALGLLLSAALLRSSES